MTPISPGFFIAIVLTALNCATAEDLALAPRENADVIWDLVSVKYSNASDIAELFAMPDRTKLTTHVPQLAYRQKPGNAPSDENKLTNQEPANLRLFRQRVARKYGKGEIERGLAQLSPAKIRVLERSNALWIAALPEDMPRIKDMIRKMDFVPPQLLIEGCVVEFPINALGVKQQIDFEPGLTALRHVASTHFRIRHMDNGTQIDCDHSYVASLEGDFDFAVTSLAANSKMQILSRPRVQTSEGVQAQLFIGGVYPRNSPGSGGAFSSAQVVLVGRTLEITPLLETNDLIELEINKATETGMGSVNIGNIGTVPARQDAHAQIIVHTGEVFAIGGMLDTNKISRFSEIEFLDHIPGGSYANKVVTYPKRTTRSELVALMRVVVLTEPASTNSEPKNSKQY